MTNEKPSKLEKWREKYAAVVVAMSLLYNVVEG